MNVLNKSIVGVLLAIAGLLAPCHGATTIGPEIKANGQTGNVLVNYSDPVSITVEMNAGIYAGAPVDWWVIALAGSSWYYMNNSMQWTTFDGDLSNCRPVHQGALENLSAMEVLNYPGLPVGSYTFWFAVDYPMDGILNINGPILYDSVKVQSMLYSHVKVNVGNTVEHRFYCGQQQFMTIVMDSNGALAIRPHPGLDINGWGSSLYLEPFLPGAVLRGTTIQSVNVQSNGINVVFAGIVSQGSAGSYGSWNGNFTFSYDPSKKDITGSGTYSINLAGALSASTGDLNLYKLASNYLVDVPLLDGTTGDTGDMKNAVVTGGTASVITWVPSMGSTYPQDYRNPISAALAGNYNQVNTAAQGYDPIAAAYKPSMTVVLSSSQTGLPLIFGASYDASESQQFWQDNVGITPLILKSSSYTHYSFNVTFDSTAIAGDH